MIPKASNLSSFSPSISILIRARGTHFIKRKTPDGFQKTKADGLFRITSHPKVNFTVVINPDSGPGSSQYPNQDYSPQIQKLNAYPNVRTIGYVRTGYATRNITAVLEDVVTYAGWAGHTTVRGIGVHGIFFDEVAYEYSSEIATYLKTINQGVKNATGLLTEKLVRIFHIPFFKGRR